MTENFTVEEGEIAGSQRFLLFPTVFSKDLYCCERLKLEVSLKVMINPPSSLPKNSAKMYIGAC